MNYTDLSFSGKFIIVLVFCLGLILTVIPLPRVVNDFRPNFFLLFTLCLVMLLPHRVNLGIAWINGLIIDNFQGILLGQYATCFVISAYLILTIRHQMLVFSWLLQIILIFGLLLCYQLLLFWLQGLQGQLVSLRWFIGSASISAVCWPLIRMASDYIVKKYALY